MCSAPMAIAHRCGDDDYGPENLLSTAMKAVKRGASIELDVRNSITNTPWIMHDWSLTRTTNGSGGVIEKTDAYLKTVVADGTGGKEHIPTLRQMLVAVKAANSFSKVVIHYNAGAFTKASIQAIQKDVDFAGMKTRVIYASWLVTHLKAFKEWADPTIERMQILEAGDPNWYPSIYQTSILVGSADDLTTAKMAEAKAKGIKVHCSAGTEAGYKKLVDMAVESNITDSPEHYWAWLGRNRTGSA